MFLSRQRLRYAFVALSALYVVALFVLAIVPYSSGDYSLPSDKILHFIEFFFLAVLLLSTFLLFEVKDSGLLVFIIVLAVVLASETVQLFVLHRSFNVLDMIADVAGASLGFAAFHIGRYAWNYFKR